MKTKFLLAIAAMTVLISLAGADSALSATLLRRGEKTGHRIEARLAEAGIRPAETDPAETDPAKIRPAESDPAEIAAVEVVKLFGQVTAVSDSSLTLLVEGQGEVTVMIGPNTQILVLGLGTREGDPADAVDGQATELTAGYWVRVVAEAQADGYLAVSIVQLAISFDPFAEPGARE